MSTDRLFLALWPDDAVRAELVRVRQGWRWPASAAPVADAKLHLTLHFLGEVRRESIAALDGCWPAAPQPFDLVLDAAEVWRNGIAALVPRAVPAPLVDLHARLADVLWDGGLRVESRRFRPHVTMARHGAGALPPPGFEPIGWRVDGYALVRSDIASGGYVLLDRFDVPAPSSRSASAAIQRAAREPRPRSR